MSPFALFLALVCAVRPTALAVVGALLASPRPRRLLLVYLIAGLAASLAVGLLLVLVFRTAAARHPHPHAGVELALGLLALFAAMRVIRDLRRSPGPGAADRTADAEPAQHSHLGGRIGRRLRDPSATTAAAAGVLTHLPGLFYLMGLDAIISTNPAPGRGIADVLVFNAIWFAIPIAALLTAVRDPEGTRARVERVTAWLKAHSREAVPVVLVAVGLYLVTKGLIDLN